MSNKNLERNILILKKAWYNKLKIFAISYIRDENAAEDLVQDTILKLLESKINIEECQNIGALLYTILKNKCLDYLKHKLVAYKHNEKMLFEYNMLLSNQYALEDNSIKIITNNQIKQALNNAIDKLPIQTKRVFIMSKYQHKKHEEIAQELNISIKTVEYHISKSYSFLRKEMKGFYALIYLIINL